MSLPSVEHRFLDDRGRVDAVWRRFLAGLGEPTDLSGLQQSIDLLQQELDAIETPRGTLGRYSVQVIPGDDYLIQLVNDEALPGETYYYGTGPSGLRGWHAVESTIAAATDELTKTVDSDTGVATFGLADAAVTPGTYTNATVTVDAKGRVTAASSGSASGSSEILVQDGASAPPVMLTNEAEDDFIYSD